MKKKTLKPEDEALWGAVTKDIAPIKRSRVQTTQPVTPKPRHPIRRDSITDMIAPTTSKGPIVSTDAAGSVTGMDGARARRLQRGSLPIDATLDLHGLTQDKAHRVLTRFLARAQTLDNRVILVITGKGGAPKPDPDNMFRETRTGVLRHAVPQWLTEPDNAGRVTAWHPAHPRHGGDGALYVVLKRLR
jgi:DNA-nicking Smr family endonuclease